MLKRVMSLLRNEGEATDERFERQQVATCCLLLEVAHSDGHYQAVEARIVHDLLGSRFNLSPAAVTELVEYAEQQRGETHDLFQFAREINANFTREEKLDVMEGVWRLIYADGTLDRYEDALARELASLLRLDHKDAIDRKLKVLDEVRSTKREA